MMTESCPTRINRVKEGSEMTQNEDAIVSEIQIASVEFSVEKVIDSVVDGDGTRYYQVKWYDTWVEESSLISKCQALVEQYWMRLNNGMVEIKNQLERTSSIACEKQGENHVEEVTSHSQAQVGTSMVMRDANEQDGDKSFQNSMLDVHRSYHGLADYAVENSDDCVFIKAVSTLPNHLVVQQNNENVLQQIHNKFASLPKKTQTNLKGAIIDHSNDASARKLKTDNTKGFACDACGKVLSSKKTLNRHNILKHLKNGRHQCQICDRRFFSQHELRRHMPVHTNIKQHICRFCGKAFKQAGQLYKHEQIHTGTKNFSCAICDKKFTQKINLQNHLSTHTDAQLFECKECNAKFKHKNSVYMHFKRCHSGIRDIVCSVCDAGFQTKTLLRTHLREMHDSVLFTCELCSKTFMVKKYLDKHMLKHQSNVVKPPKKNNEASKKSKDANIEKDNEKKENICIKNPSSLKRISRPKNTTRKSSVKELDKYSGFQVRNYVCDLCNGAFLKMDHLKLHMNIHSAVDFHLQCKFCNMSFRWKQSFLSHLHSSHKLVIETAMKDSKVGKEFGESSINLDAVIDQFVEVHSSVMKNENIKKKEFECERCDASFSCKSYLDVHQNIHSTKFYTCVKCNKKFKWLSSLAKHLERSHAHQQQQPQQLGIIDGFKVQARHFSTVDLPNLTCHLCDAAFNNKSELAKHNDLHKSLVSKFGHRVYLQEDDFSCFICQEECFNGEELQIHEETQHNVAPAVTSEDIGHSSTYKTAQTDKSVSPAEEDAADNADVNQFPKDMTIFMASKMNELLEVVKQNKMKSKQLDAT